ncbi:hypothetical protein ANANG_G00027670 [Anguilla anguilla]|uniref:Uncharacterized protein n=1 Tax=Anguilla anguilla TaxID=7936 RepID=A0A9D3MRS4_ANGAN|nr:hypothetical protein ANANG_G00027670 [Anguilla anguilla]
MLMLLIAKMQRYDEQCGERNNARAVRHCAAGELNGGSGRVLSLSAAGQDWTHQEDELHVEDEGFEDVEDQRDPTAHHPAEPSGKLPTHPAALRPVPSTPTKQSTPPQSATAAPPGTDPLSVTRLQEVPPSPSILTVAILVMGVLLFLLLAVLVVLLCWRRTLRRAPLHGAVYANEEMEYKLARGGTYRPPRWALSEWDHVPLHEAVYEEIEYKLARGGTYSAPDPEEIYDDVVTLDCIQVGNLVMEDTPEDYDYVITADKHPDSVAGELVEGDATEDYDDVITMQPGPDAFPVYCVTDPEEIYDDVVTGLHSSGGECSG